MDIRAQRSREALKKALLECMEEKPLKDIIVSDVCDRAEVTRSTFYKHYRDCDGIVDELLQEQLDRFAALLDEGARPGETLIAAVLDSIAQAKKLFHAENGGALPASFREGLERTAKEHGLQAWIERFPKIDEEVAALSYEAVLAGSLRVALSVGEKVDRETAIAVIRGMFDTYAESARKVVSALGNPPDGERASARASFNADTNVAEKARQLQSLANEYAKKYEAVMIANLNDGLYKTVSEKEGVMTDAGPIPFTEAVLKNVIKYVHESDKQMLIESVGDFERIKREYAVGESRDIEYRSLGPSGFVWYRIALNRISEDELLIALTNCDDEVTAGIVKGKLLEKYEAVYLADLAHGVVRSAKASKISEVGAFSGKADYRQKLRDFAETVAPQYKQDWIDFSDPEYMKRYMADQDTREYIYELPGAKTIMRRFTIDVTERVNGEATMLLLSFAGIDDARAKALHLQEEVARQSVQLQETLTFTQFFLDTYLSAYYVDLDDYSYKVYKCNARLEEEYLGIANYLDSITEYINRDVHPDDRERLLDAVRPAKMRQALREKPEYSLIFRDISGGVEKAYRLQVIRGAEKHHAAFGFIDISSEVNEQKERIRSAEEASNLVSNIASRYSVAFTVNMATGEYKLLKVNDKLRRTFDTIVSIEDVQRSLLEITHPQDREFLAHELSFDAARQKLQESKSYTVEFRTIINGATNWHEVSVTYVDQDEIALGFAERDLEITKRRLENKRYDEYLALFVADIDTGMIKPLKTSSVFATVGVGEAMPYGPGMKKFASAYEGDTKEFFMQLADIDYIKREFATDDKRTYSFKSTMLDSDKWMDMVSYVILRHDDGTPAMFTLGFSAVDALATSSKDLLDKLTENMQMIGGLASEYYALYYFNVRENIFRIYSLDENQLPEASNIVGSGKGPVDTFMTFGTSALVHPDDRHLFEGLTKERLLETLAHRKRFSVSFRRNFNGEYRWTEMDVVKYEDVDEWPNAIAVGFAERDAEIRREQAINRSFDVLGRELPPEEAVNLILSIAGDYYDADRCYVFEYARSSGIIDNTYEWCADGVDPMIDKLQHLPIDVVEGWNREFERQGAFHMDALDSEHNTEETVAILEMQGIDSLVAAPLMSGDEIVGFIGVDNPTKAKKDVSILWKAASAIYSEILRRKESDEEHVTLGKLTDAFLSVYYVDLATDYMRTWKIDEQYREAYGAVQNYSVAMGGYLREFIAERDRERCIRMASPEYVFEQFKGADRFSIDFTDIMLGYERSVVFDYIKVSDDGSQFVLCSRDVTESLAREKEQQKVLQAALEKEITRAREEKAYQLAILSSAYSYFRINLSQNKIVPPIVEREHGKPVDYTDKFPQPLPSGEAVMNMGADRYVDEAYKDSYRAYFNCAYLMRCFAEGNFMPEYTCRIYSTTIGWHYRKYVTYLSQDELSGDIYGMAVAYDVTKEYEIAERERQYKEQLEAAREVAEAANKSKTDFLFSMSHDIRTPMNAITGFTMMAKKYVGDEQAVAGYLDKIDVSGKQLLSLVNQVLEMARIESGQIVLDEKPVNVQSEFDIMTTVLSEQAQVNGLKLTCSLEGVEHFDVFADESRVSSVTLNITGNAMKYTPEGGSIDFILREIPARKPGYATFVFTVADTGIGMSEEFQKVLFEPFSREKSSTVSKIQGTGLGLPIVKNLVDLMGGEIEVHSELGVGTRFDVTVDFRINENASEVEEEPIGIDFASFRGLRVLLAEDNELNREIALDILGEQGFVVENAEDGRGAVEMLREKGPDYYDFVLMDIQMPMMDGYEATRAIREMYPDARLPIIALSANAFAEDKAKSLAAGMDDHVAKPIDINELFAALAKFL